MIIKIKADNGDVIDMVKTAEINAGGNMVTLRELFNVSHRVTMVDVTVRGHDLKYLKRYEFGPDINITRHMDRDILENRLVIVGEKINYHGDETRHGSEMAWGVKIKLFPKELLDMEITHLGMVPIGNGVRMTVDVISDPIVVELIDAQLSDYVWKGSEQE